jgi:hypothetical protein
MQARNGPEADAFAVDRAAVPQEVRLCLGGARALFLGQGMVERAIQDVEERIGACPPPRMNVPTVRSGVTAFLPSPFTSTSRTC